MSCQYGMFHQSKKPQLTTAQPTLLMLSNRSHQQQQHDARERDDDMT